MNIAAIERAHDHSPGMVDNDHDILVATAEQLKHLGHNVIFTVVPQADYERFDAVVHMSRTKEVLDYLVQISARGTKVFNTPQAVNRCSRGTFTRLLAGKNISQPQYTTIKGNNDIPSLGYPLWLKRGDGWSCHPSDVSFALNRDEAVEAFENLITRGAKEVICSPHIEGDIIKFYGVSGHNDTPPFFRLHYPDASKTKFGLERHNGECKEYSFDKEALQRAAFAAADAVGLDIFGGDCIISPKGEINIIDLNDFPSFSAYRNEAAKAIARLINSKLKER